MHSGINLNMTVPFYELKNINMITIGTINKIDINTSRKHPSDRTLSKEVITAHLI